MRTMISIKFHSGWKEVVHLPNGMSATHAVELMQRSHKKAFGDDACTWRVLEATNLVEAMIESARD